jgi:phosphoglycolate phosphatase
VVFDLDGTLIDSYGAIAESLNHARRSLGENPLEPETVRRMVGHGLESLMEKSLGAARVEAGVRLFREHYERICATSTVALPEVPQTLKVLGHRGLRMGVATNKPARFACRILESLELMPPIETVVGPGPAMPPKPDPTMVQRVLADLTTRPEFSVYVGDMDVDVATARAAGIQVWVLPTGSSSQAELQAAGADRILSRFGELADLLPGPEGT